MIPIHQQSPIHIDPKIPLISVLAISFVLVYILSLATSASAVENPGPVNRTGFTAPYDDYVITQGPHGFSYGHMAIDLAAGKGAVIKSPIHGVVLEKYVDGLGNPTLVIENEAYRVTILHGKYSVSVGETLVSGQPIGKESNLGNTTDMQGRPCAGRDCGYHTHLNVYDKSREQNINPLDLIRQ